MSSLSNNIGVPGSLPSLTSQTSGGSVVGGSNTAAAAPGGGMDELLPLVIQLTKPEQVCASLKIRLIYFLWKIIYSHCVIFKWKCREKGFYWNCRRSASLSLTWLRFFGIQLELLPHFCKRLFRFIRCWHPLRLQRTLQIVCAMPWLCCNVWPLIPILVSPFWCAKCLSIFIHFWIRFPSRALLSICD